MVSSKKQVKEKGKGRWSPVKVSTQSKDPPPLPPLVSDGCSQLGREGEEENEGGSLGAAASLQSAQRHL